MKTTPISIKPHHFVDIVTALGKGQTEFVAHPYGHAMHVVAAAILQDTGTTLRVELGPDSICVSCKHNTCGSCDDVIDTSYRPAAPASKDAWNLLIDTRWCERLGIRQGDVLSVREFSRRIRSSISYIPDIYREIPRERLRERQAKLRLGANALLAHRDSVRARRDGKVFPARGKA
jgi:hypothetical protein